VYSVLKDNVEEDTTGPARRLNPRWRPLTS